MGLPSEVEELPDSLRSPAQQEEAMSPPQVGPLVRFGYVDHSDELEVIVNLTGQDMKGRIDIALKIGSYTVDSRTFDFGQVLPEDDYEIVARFPMTVAGLLEILLVGDVEESDERHSLNRTYYLHRNAAGNLIPGYEFSTEPFKAPGGSPFSLPEGAESSTCESVIHLTTGSYPEVTARNVALTGVFVELFDGPSIVGSGYTDAEGYITITAPSACAHSYMLRLTADFKVGSVSKVRTAAPPAPAGATYSISYEIGGPYDPPYHGKRYDVDVGSMFAPSFLVHSRMVEAYRRTAMVGEPPTASLVVYHQKGVQAQACPGTSCFVPAGGACSPAMVGHVEMDGAGNDEFSHSWAPAASWHEYGHLVHWSKVACRPQTGSAPGHTFTGVHDNLATPLQEGWADFFSAWVAGSSTPKGASWDVESPGQNQLPEGTLACRGPHRECAIAGAFWDAYAHLSIGFSCLVNSLDTASSTTIHNFARRMNGACPGKFDVLTTALSGHGIVRGGDGETDGDAGSDVAGAVPSSYAQGALSYRYPGDGNPNRQTIDLSDWFTYPIQREMNVVVTVTPESSLDVHLYIYSPNNLNPDQPTYNVNAGGVGAIEQLSFGTTFAGGYYFRLDVEQTGTPSQGTYSFEIQVYSPGPDLQPPWWSTLPDYNYVGPDTTYEVCWRVVGNGPVDDTRVFYSSSSGGAVIGSTEVQYRAAATYDPPYCAQLTSGSSGSQFITAQALGPGEADWERSPEVEIRVANMAGPGRVTDAPTSTSQPFYYVIGGTKFGVCWDIAGSGPAPLTGVDVVATDFTSDIQTVSYTGGVVPGNSHFCGEFQSAGYRRSYTVTPWVDHYEPSYVRLWGDPVIVPVSQVWDITPITGGIQPPYDLGQPVGTWPGDVCWQVWGNGPILTRLEVWAQDYLPAPGNFNFDEFIVNSSESIEREACQTVHALPPFRARLYAAAQRPYSTNVEERMYLGTIWMTLPTVLSTRSFSSAIMLEWESRIGAESPATGYKIFRNSPSGSGLLATLAASNSTFVDREVVPGIPYGYHIVELYDMGESLPSLSVSAQTDPLRVASAEIIGIAGQTGLNGWFTSPVSLAVIANGSSAGGNRTVEEIELRRNGTTVGHLEYLEEFEDVTPWESNNPFLRVTPETQTVRQGSAALNATLLPSDYGAEGATISRNVDWSVGGFDRADLWVRYDSTHPDPAAAGDIEVRLYDSAGTLVSSRRTQPTGTGWVRVELDLAGLDAVSRFEVVVFDPRRDALPRIPEVQSIVLDGFVAFVSADLRESAQGLTVWDTVVTTPNGDLLPTPGVPIGLDWTAPTTASQIMGELGPSNWYRSAVDLTLGAHDNESGIMSTTVFYRGTQSAYTAPRTASSDGTHCYSYWSRDIAGNLETPKDRCFKIDKTAPTTNTVLQGIGDGTWYSGPVTVSFQPADATSGVATTYFGIDGDPYQPSTGPVVVNEDGNHIVRWYSVDYAGNEQSLQTKSFSIERNAPIVRDRQPVPGSFATTSAVIRAVHDDANGTYQSGINAARTIFILERSLAGPKSLVWADATSEGTTTRTAASTEWSANGIGGLQPGWYRVRGTIFDRAGNSAPLELLDGWEFSVSVGG